MWILSKIFSISIDLYTFAVVLNYPTSGKFRKIFQKIEITVCNYTKWAFDTFNIR